MKYQVHLEVFEGTLDLLIKQLTTEEIPAGKVSVCKIIDQFVDYYMGIAFSDLEEGSRFLVLVATLLAVKARLLLPRREDEDESGSLLEEEDGEGSLETDFGEYLAFQEAAVNLDERGRQWMKVYKRPSLPVQVSVQRGIDGDISRLVEAFQDIVERISKTPEPYTVNSVPYDLDSVMESVLLKLKSRPQGLYFSEFFPANFPANYRREEVIVTFLAVLELVYEGKMRVQNEQEKEELLLVPGEELR